MSETKEEYNKPVSPLFAVGHCFRGCAFDSLLGRIKVTLENRKLYEGLLCGVALATKEQPTEFHKLVGYINAEIQHLEAQSVPRQRNFLEE